MSRLPVTPSSMVLLETTLTVVGEELRVQDNVYRWGGAGGGLPFLWGTGGTDTKASLDSLYSTVSTASNGATVLVYTRESQTDLGARVAVVKSLTWTPDSQPVQLPSFTCNIDEGIADKPCTTVSLVALPSGAVLLSKNGMYFLA